MKIVVFEGIDKIGKTTLLNKVYDKLKQEGLKPMLLNLPFTLESCHDENELSVFRLKTTLKTIRKMYEYFDDTYVLLIDRFHLSEQVYDKVLRGRQHQCVNTLGNIAYKMKDMNALLIYMTTHSVAGLYDKFKDENDLIDGLTWEQYYSSHEEFFKAFDESDMIKQMIFNEDETVSTYAFIEDYIMGPKPLWDLLSGGIK